MAVLLTSVGAYLLCPVQFARRRLYPRMPSQKRQGVFSQELLPIHNLVFMTQACWPDVHFRWELWPLIVFESQFLHVLLFVSFSERLRGSSSAGCSALRFKQAAALHLLTILKNREPKLVALQMWKANQVDEFPLVFHLKQLNKDVSLLISSTSSPSPYRFIWVFGKREVGFQALWIRISLRGICDFSARL